MTAESNGNMEEADADRGCISSAMAELTSHVCRIITVARYRHVSVICGKTAHPVLLVHEKEMLEIISVGTLAM